MTPTASDTGWAPEKLNPRARSLAKGAITAEALAGASAAVFGCPTQPFTPAEVVALHVFVEQVALPPLRVCVFVPAGCNQTLQTPDLRGQGPRRSPLRTTARLQCHTDFSRLLQQLTRRVQVWVEHNSPMC